MKLLIDKTHYDIGIICTWLFFLIVSSVALFINQYVITNNSIMALLSILLYVYFIYILWQTSQMFVIISFIYLFGQFTTMLSSAYLETGTYISEQQIMSYPTGGTFRLYALCIIFFVSGLVSFKWIERLSYRIIPINEKRITEPNSINIKVLITLGLITILGLIGGLIYYGSPLILGIQRFIYWSELDNPLSNFIKMTLYLALPIGAMQVTLNRSTSYFCRFWFYASLCALILYGEKFSGLYLIIVLYYIGVYIRTYANGRMLQVFTIRNMIIISVVCISMFSLVYFHYLTIHSVDTNIFDYILSRIFALQGHTWWGIDTLMSKGMASHGIDKLTLKNTVNVPGGLYLLMYEISPTKLVNLYKELGITFTMGSPAIAVYSIGYFGACIYQLLGGVLVGAFLSIGVALLKHGHFIIALLFSKVIFVFIHVFSMGNTYTLFLPTAIGSMFLLILSIKWLIKSNYVKSSC